MCVCDDEEDAGEQVVMDAATLARARLLEDRMDGERVPGEAWSIFSGTAGGGIAWAHYQRMQASYDSAAAVEKGFAYLKGERHMARKIRCEPMAL